MVRGFLTLAELDIDRAYIFWFNDEDKPTLHASSGLTRNYQPKLSFHAVAHLLATLGDYRLSKVEKKPAELCQLEFTHATEAKKRVTVAWSPTGDGRSKKQTITMGGKVERAERMPLKAGAADSVPWASDKIGIIEIEVGESPVYVHWRLP